MAPAGRALFIQFTETGSRWVLSQIGSVSVLRICHFEPKRDFFLPAREPQLESSGPIVINPTQAARSQREGPWCRLISVRRRC